MLSSNARQHASSVALICLVCSTLLAAQSTGGRLLGPVWPIPSGAILAGVKVTLTK
jgi:hypothetical protein